MSSNPNSLARRPLVGRPTATRMFGGGAAGLLLSVGALLVIMDGNVWGLLLLALGFYGLSELWRKVTVNQDMLVAQGRVTRRSTALVTLHRVGVSTSARAWVAPRNRQPFYLRMLTDEAGWATPGVWEFVPALRERALAAGASLQDEVRERTEPPPGIGPWFSA